MKRTKKETGGIAKKTMPGRTVEGEEQKQEYER
jgi:hypothetical protein